MRRIVLSMVLLCACGDESSRSVEPGGGDGPPAGYARLRATPLVLAPGQSTQWVEWVRAPADHDVDVVDVRGWQSAGGHHVIVYSSRDLQDVGTARAWLETDQLRARFVGGSGGEGGEDIRPPDGVVFRIPAGEALLLQTHWINTSDTPLVGEAYVDVKLAEPSPDATVASFFGTATLDSAVEPGVERTRVYECVVPRELRLYSFVNHMHRMGVAARTTLITPEGEQVIKDDPVWDYEWALNPNFAEFTADAPMILPAGAILRTECHFRNTSSERVAFPDEMCAFFGLVQSDRDVNCADGNWND